MYNPSSPHAGRTALTFGASAGLGMGIVQSLLIVYVRYPHYMSHSYLAVFVLPLSLLLWIALFLLVGAFAAHKTGKVSTGTLAGLWSGLIGGIITSLTLFVTLFAALFPPMNGPQSYMSIVAAAYLTFLIFLTLVMLGAGTGLGALGGLIGQSFSPARPTMLVQTRQSDPPPSYPAE